MGERSITPLPQSVYFGTELVSKIDSFVDPHKIGVDDRRLQSLMKRTGIKTLHLTASMGETSSVSHYSPLINSESTQTLTRARSLDTVPVNDTANSDISGVSPNHLWTRATLPINVNELRQRAELKTTKNWPREKVVAKELSNAMRIGLVAIGIKQLFSSDYKNETNLPIVVTLANLLINTPKRTHLDYIPLEMIITYTFLSLFFTVSGELINNVRAKRDEILQFDLENNPFRFSLFYGYQFDRMAWLKLVSQNNPLPLVSPIKQ